MQDPIFENKRPLPEKLLEFGFVLHNNSYIYSYPCINNELRIEVTVTLPRSVSSRVLDGEEEYILHRIAGAQGAFVGQVRREEEDLLTAIGQRCFVSDVFQSPDTLALLDYAKNTYGDDPEFPWARTPEYAVLRRQDTQKWYAVLMRLPPQRLGLPAGPKIEVVNLHTLPGEPEKIRDGRSRFPGYHMNKTHWVTLCLDGSLPPAELLSRLDTSYILAKK